MKRLTGRRVPPANSVPEGLQPIRPPRRRPPARRRYLITNTTAVAALGTSTGTFTLASGHPYIQLFALFAFIIIGGIMIQDLLRGLFGTPPAPDRTALVDSSATPDTTPALPEPVAPAALPAPAAKASDNPKIPTVARPVVLQIEAKIERTLAAVHATDLGDMTVRELTDMRDVHLPTLITSYVDIPPEHRAQIFAEKGKSASYILQDSLLVMSARVDEISKNLAKREISSFEDQNRFISDRYGKHEDPFA